MVIFNSYVSLPEGITHFSWPLPWLVMKMISPEVPRSSAPFPDDAPFVNFASQLPLPETHRLTMALSKKDANF
jgi:hypothetical protein